MPRIGFVGDVYPGPAGGIEVDDAVARWLHGFDLVVANLEGPVTVRSEPAVDKRSHLRSDPAAASALLDRLAVGVASVANNHMFDFGSGGYADTARFLSGEGISAVGAGPDLAAARRPVVVEVGGLRVGFLAYSSPLIETTCATPQTAGCAPLDAAMMEHDVAALAGRVELVVVLVHWGLTGYALPTPEHRALGSALVGAGAHLVVGSHPHVVQGVRREGAGLVVPSLGDFAFFPATASGRAVNQYRSRQTGLVLGVEVDAAGVRSHDLYLTRQRGSRLGQELSARRREAVVRAGARLAAPGYGRRWKRYVARRTVTRTARRLAPWNWRRLGPGAVRGFGVAVREIMGRRSTDV